MMQAGKGETRRIRVLVAVALAVLLLAVSVGAFWFNQVVSELGGDVRANARRLLAAQNVVSLSVKALAGQTQAWKDLLLRQRDATLAHNYQQELDDFHAELRANLQRVRELVQGLGIEPARVDDMLEQEEALAGQYAAAARKLDAARPLSFREADRLVIGQDRALRASLWQLQQEMNGLIAREVSRLGVVGEGRHAPYYLLGALAIALPLVLSLLFFLIYHSLRRIARGDARIRAIHESIGDAVVVADAQGRIEALNAAAEKLTGWRSGAARGRTVHEVMQLYNAATRQRVECPIEEVLRRGSATPLSNGLVLRRPDGGECIIEDAATPVRDERGELIGAVMVMHDVTQRYAMLSEVRRERALFRQTFDLAQVGMAHLATDGRWLRVNRKLCEITGYSEAELLALTFRGITHPEDVGQDVSHLGELLAGKLHNYHVEKRYIRKDGEIVWVALTVSIVFKEDGTPDYGISIIEDIQARKDAERQIEHLAYHDQLTGLANRRLLHDRLAQAINSAQRRNAHVAVLYLDLDHFKDVNDSLGHPVGDRLLARVAERLHACARAEDTLARVGGDEFVVMLNDIEHADTAAGVAQKIIETLRQPLLLDGNELRITPSVGISVYPQDGRDAETLLQNADAALYLAKQQGRATYRFYTEDLHRQAVERLQIERLLHHALAANEFELHYQPKLDLLEGRVVGCEALIRWNHPEHGMMSPAQFIPVAEQSILIVEIGNWVIREVCRQAALWQRQGCSLRVAFNVSARQFMRPQELLTSLREALHASGADASLLEIEMTESLLLDERRMQDVLQEIRGLGIHLTLDDFGTGYSSLSYLRKFPLDAMKIDRSFVSDADRDPHDAEMVKTIIGMAHNLNLGLVAEGIENEGQRALLAAQGCEHGQGYHFSRPLPVEEFEAFLRNQQETPREQ